MRRAFRAWYSSRGEPFAGVCCAWAAAAGRPAASNAQPQSWSALLTLGTVATLNIVRQGAPSAPETCLLKLDCAPQATNSRLSSHRPDCRLACSVGAGGYDRA